MQLNQPKVMRPNLRTTLSIEGGAVTVDRDVAMPQLLALACLTACPAGRASTVSLNGFHARGVAHAVKRM